MRYRRIRKYVALFIALISFAAYAQPEINGAVRETDVAEGWAKNSVNTAVFRKNSLVTHNDTQFIAFYDAEKYMVLGKRKSGSERWTLRRTSHQGNVEDAHNAISIIVDGDGYLHAAWDHHNTSLKYSRSAAPGSLKLTASVAMTGADENSVSYPEFYALPGGALLFFYRDGGSGKGNLVINRYDLQTKSWRRLHTNLIDGEGERNAYWQACVDAKGVVHISWVWRETPDVASNHDLCYARSTDGGVTWEKSGGEKYKLPITAATAEYARKIPQSSELINQTSMTADAEGNPVIASYWREPGASIPQYHLVYLVDKSWKTVCLDFRQTPFTLSGGGTKRIPIARPQVVVSGSGERATAFVIFRDQERGASISVAACNLHNETWQTADLLKGDFDSWEPTYDTELWRQKEVLNLFVQKVVQIDEEGKANIEPQMIKVLEWRPGEGSPE